MALSSDRDKRARQLANLRTGPPAPRGNRKAVKHGARAQVEATRLTAKAQAIYDELAEAAPVRAPSGDLPIYDRALVRLLARCLCRLEDVTPWLDKHGPFDRRGKPRSALKWERLLRKEAAEYLDAMGMTPKARARLGVDLARTADLATAMSEPDPERRKRLMAEAGLEDDDEG